MTLELLSRDAGFLEVRDAALAQGMFQSPECRCPIASPQPCLVITGEEWDTQGFGFHFLPLIIPTASVLQECLKLLDYPRHSLLPALLPRLFHATLKAYRTSQARDQIQVKAMTYTTTVATLEP